MSNIQEIKKEVTSRGYKPKLILEVEIIGRKTARMRVVEIAKKYAYRSGIKYRYTYDRDVSNFHISGGMSFSFDKNRIVLPSEKRASRLNWHVVSFEDDEERKKTLRTAFETLSMWSYTFDYTKRRFLVNVLIRDDYWIVL